MPKRAIPEPILQNPARLLTNSHRFRVASREPVFSPLRQQQGATVCIKVPLGPGASMSMLAGGTGLLFAWWSLRFLIVQVAASMPPYWGTIALHLAPDHRVFAYLLLLSVVSTGAFGLVPALAASKPDLVSALKEEGAAFGGGFRKSRLRDILVAMQVAVCLVLLVIAGLLARLAACLFGRSRIRLSQHHIDRGWSSERNEVYAGRPDSHTPSVA